MSDGQVCRLCAGHDLQFLDISTSDEDDCALINLIRQYLALEVVVEEGCLSVVCTVCCDTLASFHCFATRCREAQSTLKERSRVKVELCKLEDAVHVTEDLLKNENIKLEHEERNAVSDFDVQDFECDLDYDEWLPTVEEIPIKVRKKRGRKPKIKTSESSPLDELIKFENKEIKTEDESDYSKHIKRKYTKSGKYKRHPDDKERTKRSYIRRDHAKLESDLVTFVCYVCGDNGSTSKISLKDHERSHLILDKKWQWPCPKCEKTFKDKNIALRHMRSIHEGVADFICHACGRRCITKGGLEEHLITHSEVRPYQCDKCHKRFKGKPSLKRHMDTHRDTAYQCPKCAQLLNSRVTLRNHLHTHDEVGRQECHLCSKRFKTRKALKVHLLIHTGERPFSCPWCPKTFANNSNCRIHKKRVHMPELMKFEAERAAKLANQFETEEDQTSSFSVQYDSFDDEPLTKFNMHKTSRLSPNPL